MNGDSRSPVIYHYDEEALRFKTIAEFKDAMRCGAEVNLEWNGTEYFTS